MIQTLLLLLVLLPSVALAQTAFESYVLSDIAPVVFWYETEPSGTTIVNHGSGGATYNLTTNGSPTLGQAGVSAARGTSILWASASSQYANVSKVGGVGGFNADRTWSCWVKLTDATQHGTIMSTSVDESGTQAGRVARLIWVGSTHMEFNLFQTPGASNYIQAAGTALLTSGTWYMVTGTWVNNTTTLTLYINATQDASTSTTSGAGPATGVFYGLSRSEGDNTLYLGGNSQDCFIDDGALSAAQVSILYNRGIGLSSSNWPYTVKRPYLPQFRDDGYFAKFFARGYHTGLFSIRARVPQYLTLGYLPFAIVPPGNVR